METTQTTLTKGGEFVIKSFDAQEIFTPEDFSEEQQMMKEAVQEFIDREVIPNKAQFEKKDYALTQRLMQQAGELGFLSVAIPEAYGGMGMDFVSTMLVCDYISGATGSFSTAFGAHTGIGTMPITLYGTEEQKQTYVPKLATGEWFGAYCLTEPGAGSDANSGRTKAVLSADGSHYKITGQKMWISNAGFADLFIVFARIEDDKNITGFIVPKDLENGITLGDEEHKLGIHSSSTRQVFFNETKVPVENMLAGRGEGFKIAMNALNVGRIKLAAACLDAQRRATSIAVQYANERVQFKTPIAQFGAIQEKLAEMATNTYVGESASYRAAYDIKARIESLQDEGKGHQEAELQGVEEFAIECSLLKVALSEDVQHCADQGLQIFGGMGFSADAPMEAAWRDARIGRIYEGTNEINRMLSVGMLLKKAMKGQLDLMAPVMAIGSQLASPENIPAPSHSGPLALELNMIQNLKNIFLLVAGSAVQKYATELEKNQELLLALSDILIETYMAESALLRTLKNMERSNADTQTHQIAMSQLYLYKAVEICVGKAREAIVSIASGSTREQLLNTVSHLTKEQPLPNVVALKRTIAKELIDQNEYGF
ncbi:MAG: acyl-CoA dehydrogenase family protein [Flavobacteriaceae bacterium]